MLIVAFCIGLYELIRWKFCRFFKKGLKKEKAEKEDEEEILEPTAGVVEDKESFVWLSPAGECYHWDKNCVALRKVKNPTKKRECLKCAERNPFVEN